MNIAWDEEVRRRVIPHLFTTEAWAALSDRQRQVIASQRRAVVEGLQLEHERRYHSTRHLISLEQALHQQAGPDAQ